MNLPLPENHWGYRRRLQFVLDQVSTKFPHKTVSVLDIGCGNGSQFAIPMSKLGYFVTGIDPHQPSIARARSYPGTCRFVCGTVDSLDQRFDVVVVSEVLEHLQNPENLLRQSVERLSDKGLLIVTVPNGYGEFEIDNRAYYGLGLNRALDACFNLVRAPREGVAGSDDTSPHLQRFTLPRLRRMFAAAGLKIVSRRGTSFASGPLVVRTIGKLPGYIRLNAKLADFMPLWCVSGWMFALEAEICSKEVIRRESSAAITSQISL
jgi:2-polyprenyl-3-methyl-5-hydroxy-6-metoxy-1,4-benzoquinol methylase